MIYRAAKAAACGLLLVTLGSQTVIASAPPSGAESHLVLEINIDGKCQNLSEGGKLQVLRNLHPTRKIKFRLIRYFVDVRQQGRATGVAQPNGELVKLGCTKVGGRLQRWVVERAEFIADEHE